MEITITKDDIIFPSLTKTYKQAVGVSIAANMRDALKEFGVKADEVVVRVATPSVMLTLDALEEEDAEKLYKLTVTTTEEEIVVMNNQVLQMQIALLFSVSKDLMTVVEDNFQQYEVRHVMAECFSSINPSDSKDRILHAYFYDKMMYVYAFKHGRLLFYNEYEAVSSQDCTFLLLSVYKQLGYNQLKDEIVLEGEVAFKDELKDLLTEFVKNISA